MRPLRGQPRLRGERMQEAMNLAVRAKHDHWIADKIVALLGEERTIRCFRASLPDRVDKPLLRGFVSGMRSVRERSSAMAERRPSRSRASSLRDQLPAHCLTFTRSVAL